MPVKLIVTHKGPDLDAACAVWLLKRKDEQNYGQAEVAFANPGEQISLDELSKLNYHSMEIVHVDTGGGEFDHHSPDKSAPSISATSLVYEHISNKHPELTDDQALRAIVELVTQIDHYAEAYWPERNETRAYFYLSEILPNLKNIGLSDAQIIEYAMVSLDAIHSKLTAVNKAKADIESAIEFYTPWGKGLAAHTSNPQFIDQAQRLGYVVAVSKDSEYDHVRIKALPGKKIDLTRIYEKINNLENDATWYFHPSKTMLINGSDKNRNQVASRLKLEQIIKLFKEI